jgi:hypothetical protein
MVVGIPHRSPKIGLTLQSLSQVARAVLAPILPQHGDYACPCSMRVLGLLDRGESISCCDTTWEIADGIAVLKEAE